MEDFIVGTSGYDYPEWKGVFYPEDLARKDFLHYYATQFNGVELNNTFYSMPNSQRMENFIIHSDGKINFSVKAHKTLTHEISRSWKEDAIVFKDALQTMKKKELLCGVLFQFPQSFHYVEENRWYLSHLMEAFEGYPVIVEFRHKEWLRDSVFEGLEKRKVSVAFCDMPDLKNLPVVEFSNSIYSRISGSTFYLRLHGRNTNAWYTNDSSNNGSARYDYEYSKEELEKFVPVIHFIKNAGKKAQVFFNNHPKGLGAKNAKMFKEMI